MCVVVWAELLWLFEQQRKRSLIFFSYFILRRLFMSNTRCGLFGCDIIPRTMKSFQRTAFLICARPMTCVNTTGESMQYSRKQLHCTDMTALEIFHVCVCVLRCLRLSVWLNWLLLTLWNPDGTHLMCLGSFVVFFFKCYLLKKRNRSLFLQPFCPCAAFYDFYGAAAIKTKRKRRSSRSARRANNRRNCVKIESARNSFTQLQKKKFEGGKKWGKATIKMHRL